MVKVRFRHLFLHVWNETKHDCLAEPHKSDRMKRERENVPTLFSMCPLFAGRLHHNGPCAIHELDTHSFSRLLPHYI